MFSRDLSVNACYENEEYNEFAGAILELSVTGTETKMNTAMMLFNNGYAVTVMDTSSNMMVQVTTQQPAVSNHDDPLEHYGTTDDCQDSMLVLTSSYTHTQCCVAISESFDILLFLICF